MARTTTDERGLFVIEGVRGGSYNILVAGTAPPTAREALLVVTPDPVALGQNAGGTFWRTVTNPWVSAGLIGAAVAVPIALNNNASGS